MPQGLAKWRGNVTNLIRSRRHVEEQCKGKVSARVRRRDLVNVASLIVVAQGFSRRQRFAKPPTSTENAPLIYAMTVSEWSSAKVICPGASEFAIARR